MYPALLIIFLGIPEESLKLHFRMEIHLGSDTLSVCVCVCVIATM